MAPEALPPRRLFVREGLTSEPIAAGAVNGEAAAWLKLRVTRSAADAAEFHGLAW